MPAPYHRNQTTGNQGGDGCRSSLQQPSQWTGSDHALSGANAAGSCIKDGDIVLGEDLEQLRSGRAHRVANWTTVHRRIRRTTLRPLPLLVILAFVIFLSGVWFMRKGTMGLSVRELDLDPVHIDTYSPPVPEILATAEPKAVDPVQWLRENTHPNLDHLSFEEIDDLKATKPNAALISLVRNSELDAMIGSISQVEERFNNRVTHHYDWVFFNNEEFTEEFKAAMTNATDSQCYFEIIPPEHWSIPDWIDRSRFDVGRQYMGDIGVGKAWLESYHHMCRWNSGLFAREKRLDNYDFYWRVEPGVEFFCDVNYDVFKFMNDNDLAYGFNMALLEDERAIPSLWEKTRDFITANQDILDAEADLSWLLHNEETAHVGGDSRSPPNVQSILDSEYNNCQFYSNFEIGSLNFFRGEKNSAYFNFLDKHGGFFYERLGDAPVHTLSVSMFLPKSQIWYFRDIGYSHSICQQCPPHEDNIHASPGLHVRRTGEATKTTATKADTKTEFGVGAAKVPSDKAHDIANEEVSMKVDGVTEKVTNKEVNGCDTDGVGMDDSEETVGTITKFIPVAASTKELVITKDIAVTSKDATSDLVCWARERAMAAFFVSDVFGRWEMIAEDVERQKGIPGLACGCTVNPFDENISKLVPFESKQRKPSDTCVRRWLGGRWLEKKPGWTRQADIAAGGDGYGGYVLDGLLSNPFTKTPSSMN